MKNRCVIPFMLLCAALACLSSCEKIAKFALDKAIEGVMDHEYQDSEEWGKVITKDLNVGSFNRVDLRGAVRLEYTQDSLFRVQVYGNEKAIEAYDIAVKNAELVANLKQTGSNIDKNSARITLRVSAPYLLKAGCSGASQMVFENVCQPQDLWLVVSGAGKISMSNSEVRNLEIGINGAGEAELKDVRATQDTEMSVSGAGELSGNLSCRNLKVSLAGAGESTLVLDCQEVNVSCSGATSLSLTGHCTKLEQSTSGSGKLNASTLDIAE